MPRSPQFGEYRTLRIHPSHIIMTLLLLGLSVLFLGFTGAYIYSRVQNQGQSVELPMVFVFNSVFLLGSSACLWQANKAYRDDHTARYQYALWGTLLLTLLFLAAQIYGWQLLETRGKIGEQYVKALSIMHFLHVVGGIPFLALFIVTASRRMREPVSVLVYFSDPEKKLKLRLLNLYWHFLDGLWIFLIVLFLVTKLLG
jgi:cytochrome c oxidase subunit 3